MQKKELKWSWHHAHHNNKKKRTRDKENLNGNVGDEEGTKKRCELQKKRTVVEELHTHLFEKKPKTFLYQILFSLP